MLSQCFLLGAVRLGILEREPARALVIMMVLANHSRIAGKHDAVQPKDAEYGTANTAEKVPRLAGPSEAAVAVECAGSVVDGCDDKDGVGVGRNAAFGDCR